MQPHIHRPYKHIPMKWNILSSQAPHTPQDLIDQVLKQRQISDTETFLHPKHPIDYSVEEVGIQPDQMKKAVHRLEVAQEKKEKIIIFGDYDCDGVCATAVMWETLHELGMNVFPFIPNREKHGYGLSSKALDEILGEGKPDILISVDNGIVAHGQWERLRQEGVFTILTDHHEPDDRTSPADIIIHTTQLCGTTVAWMLARELFREKAATLLDLCVVATIADQVPLIGANRSFAKHGLIQLGNTQRVGLQLLMEAAGVDPSKVTTSSVSYGIVPRINAMGRLGSALDALRALCTHNRLRAKQLVETLHGTNIERQELTQESIDLALSCAAQWKDEHIIVIAHESFHEGIIGLIASKLTETFYKPSIVISIGTQTSKASCRSIPGVHITNMVRSLREDVLEVGGHPMAAGIRIATDHIETFTQNICAYAKQTIAVELLEPSLTIDAILPSDFITLETALVLNALEPFGAANREPLFLIEKMVVKQSRVLGKEGKHLKLSLSSLQHPERLIDAIAFGMGKRDIQAGSTIDCVASLSVNEWKGRVTPQIVVKDYVLC